MNSDVRAVRVTGVATAVNSRSRIHAIHAVSGAGAARLTITDGSGGPTLIDIDFAASETNEVPIPLNGVIAQNAIQVSTFSNLVAVTIFYT